MKRIFVNILLILCLFPLSVTVQAAEETKVYFPEITVEQGETAEVSLQISGNPGLAAWMFELSWDTDALILEDTENVAQAGSAFSGGTSLGRQTETGIVVSWFSTGNRNEDGELLRFRVKAEGKAGRYPITITCSEKNTLNVSGALIPVTTVTGSITITGESAAPSPPPASSGGSARPSGESTPPQKEENTSPVNPFSDVAENAYYYDPVLWAVSQKITAGTSATTFTPNAACTRAQTVTFLWRAAGSPEPVSKENPFSDIAESSYYYRAVLWAAENGITGGTTATTFAPNATVTRAQVVTFLWRYAGKTTVSESLQFEDVSPSQYYSDAVKWAAAKGITGGTAQTTFSPMNACTRGQIVTFLFRHYGQAEENS